MQIIAPLLLAAMVVSGASQGTNNPGSREVDLATVDPHRISRLLLNKNPELYRKDKTMLQHDIAAFIERYQVTNKRNLRKTSGINAQLTPTKNDRRLAKGSIEVQAKVLAVLVDFPDLPHTAPRITSNHTDMYYANYPVSHYQHLLFSDNGFVGPKGDNHQSVKQYFGHESGGSFDFIGDVSGWLRADNNARYYGSNKSANSDQRVEELVVEAVTKAVSAGVKLEEFDRDGDGTVDHLLIFHSSIGEEAGGGVLGESAIWSHRYSVANINNGQPVPIVGTDIKIANYTIQPIDSGPGVVAHEFGHDLGLIDEYDLVNPFIGAPVQQWSLMAGGSWVGEIRGTQPSSFSPLARELLQASVGGNWINQSELASSRLNETPQRIVLQAATDHHSGVNQLKLTLPPSTKHFKTPHSGLYQYYSGQQSERRASLSFTVTLPQSNNLSLSMVAQWAMELDYDYTQLLINGVAQANAQTAASSGLVPSVSHYISGKSPLDSWQTLNFDLNQFAGQDVTIELTYVTDQAVNEFGVVVDNIQIRDGDTIVFDDGGEGSTTLRLTDFIKIGSRVPKEPVSYYLQYRSLIDLDSGLTELSFEPGLLLWLADANYDDNNVSDHPGHGFISVVDADQQMISDKNTSVQLRDAAFSLNEQKEFVDDSHLNAQPRFHDTTDYSSAAQPQSGVVLPIYNIQFEVVEQLANSITIDLSKPELAIEASFSAQSKAKTVEFNAVVKYAQDPAQYLWDFGDGQTSTLLSPKHVYADYGHYHVSLTVHDSLGNNVKSTQRVTVALPLQVETNASSSVMDAQVQINISSGNAPFELSVDFADGRIERQTIDSYQTVNLTHVYALSALHNVAITVTDTLEQEYSSGIKLTISSGLSASFTHTNNNLVTSFNSELLNGIGDKTILWSFGDGSSSNLAAPSHAYATGGSYSVKLTVTDQSQMTATYTQTVMVSAESVKVPTASTNQESSGGGVGWLGIVPLLLSITWRLLNANNWLNKQRYVDKA